MFKNDLKLYISSYLKFSNLKFDEKYLDNIENHINKSDFIILLSLEIFKLLLNSLSIILFLKQFSSLKDNNIRKLLNLLRKNFLKKKIDELIFAIFYLYQEDEELKTTNIKNQKDIFTHIFDYIVIGSGPAGSIIASKLRKKRKKILIIEEGDNVSLPNSKHPANEFKLKWRDGGISSTVFPKQISFARGKCFGGGSEINSGLLHKTPEDFLNNLRTKFQVKNLDTLKIENYFNDILSQMNTSNFDISKEGCHKIFKKACENLNYQIELVPRLMNYNLSDKNVKRSMTNTFLKSYLEDGGLTLLGSKVTRVSEEEDFCNVFLYSDEFGDKILKSKKIVLSCGAIETNKILLNSKLIPKSKKKIVKKFNLHPMLKCFVEFDEKVNIENFQDVHPFQLTEFYPDYIIGKAASNNKFKYISSFGNSDMLKYLDNKSDYISVYHITFSDGVGDIFKIPLLNRYIYTYNFSKKMEQKVTKSLEIFCKIFFSSDKVKKLFLLTDGVTELSRNNYLEIIKNQKIFKKIKFSAVHVMGGVPFGENKKNTVADSFGKLHSCKNIYVNDSSLINDKLLKNPQGTVMTLTERFLHYLDD